MKSALLTLAVVLTGALALGGAAEKEPEAPRGTLVFEAAAAQRASMEHWDEYPWTFEAIRWGRYRAEVSYHGLKRAMGVQARLGAGGEDRAKGFLQPGGTEEEPRTVRLGGTLHVPAQGGQQLVLVTPPDDPIYHFKLVRVRLVPAPEGEAIAQDAGGALTLLAKDATTFSEKMRYEPKEEKNCLGFWVLKDDWAEWEFEIAKGGRFKVTVFHGCGKGNHGSTVAVESGDQRLSFEVQDTGGYQNWQPAAAGELKLEAGKHRLAIRPVKQAKGAVMDVQKVMLEPVGNDE